MNYFIALLQICLLHCIFEIQNQFSSNFKGDSTMFAFSFGKLATISIILMIFEFSKTLGYSIKHKNKVVSEDNSSKISYDKPSSWTKKKIRKLTIELARFEKIIGKYFS